MRDSTWNESVPKTVINDTMIFFHQTAIGIWVISNHNSFRVLFDKTASVDFFLKKNINISALEMASPGNRHCVNSIGTLSFHTATNLSGLLPHMIILSTSADAQQLVQDRPTTP